MHQGDIVWQSSLALESVKLGRLVVNLDDPHQDFFDPESNLTPQVLKRPLLAYVDIRSIKGSKDFNATVTGLISGSSADQKWFKASLRDQEARKWIEEANGAGDDIYVVVGFQTVKDAKVQGLVGLFSDKQGRIQLPLAETAAAASGVPVPGLAKTADPSAHAHVLGDSLLYNEHLAPGEQIHAVQYRKVQFKWFSGSDIDKATLEKGNRWKIHSVVRGQESRKDILEVTIPEDDANAEEVLEERSS